jgi:NitT/TauT family transport system permease protein
MKLFSFQLPMMTSLLIWAVLWAIVGQLELTIPLPPLSSVLSRMVEIVPTASFMSAFGVTARAFLLGTGAAIQIGVPLGVLMGKNVLVDRLCLPWVNMFLSAPLTALVPVLMVLFGIGEQTVIITTTLFAIWIIVLNARVPSGPATGPHFQKSMSGRRCRRSFPGFASALFAPSRA